jgi:hypothetical protein
MKHEWVELPSVKRHDMVETDSFSFVEPVEEFGSYKCLRCGYGFNGQYMPTPELKSLVLMDRELKELDCDEFIIFKIMDS